MKWARKSKSEERDEIKYKGINTMWHQQWHITETQRLRFLFVLVKARVVLERCSVTFMAETEIELLAVCKMFTFAVLRHFLQFYYCVHLRVKRNSEWFEPGGTNWLHTLIVQVRVPVINSYLSIIFYFYFIFSTNSSEKDCCHKRWLTFQQLEWIYYQNQVRSC